MKKLSILLLLATTMAATSFAQNDPRSLRRNQLNGPLNIETISAHNYSVIGMDLHVITAARKDTINFVTATMPQTRCSRLCAPIRPMTAH